MPEIADSFGLLVEEGQAARTHYDLAHLQLGAEGETFSINLIPIAEIDKALLVAVPLSSWSRTVNDRLLPKGGLQKAVLVEVASVLVEEPERAESARVTKLWVGLLAKNLRRALQPGGMDDAATDVFTYDEELGVMFMPSGPALAQLADEHFAFMSAVSGEQEVQSMDERIGKLEETMELVRKGLERVLPQGERKLGKSGPDVGDRAEQPALTRPTGEPRRLSGLDPTVVASAREAGISEQQLGALAKLFGKGGKLGDAPGLRRKAADLSETEEDEDAEADDEDVELYAEKPSIEKAVAQLTKIVGSLAQKKKSGRDLETLLDGVEGGESASSSGGGKTKAAAYKKLRASLEEDPKTVYRAVEKLLERDFLSVRSGPGAGARSATSRAWLEHRSHLGNFPNTVRMAWIVAGIHDALRQGAHEEARARCAVALAAIDQAALDQGNWTLAQEVLLEQPAPYQAFSHRRTPDSWELAGSRLLDERWVEVLMWKVKDRDAYFEARRIAATRSKGQFQSGNPADNSGSAAANVDGSKGGKGKPKGGKAGGKEAPPPPS